jgi:hypothetical protein
MDRAVEKALCQLLANNKALQSIALDISENGDPE